MPNMSSILCPIDFSKSSQVVADYAGMLARLQDGNIDLVYILHTLGITEPLQMTDKNGELLSQAVLVGNSMYGAQPELLKEIYDKLLDFSVKYLIGVKVRLHIFCCSDITKAILDVSQKLNSEVIVMGAHGRKGLSLLVFGSVASGISKESKIPVLLVRPKD